MTFYLSGKVKYYQTNEAAETLKTAFDNKYYTNDNSNDNSPKKVCYAGKNWVLFYSGSKELKGWKYAALLIQSLVLTWYTWGLWLISENLRDDWQAIWNGKKIREIYIETDEPPIQNKQKTIMETPSEHSESEYAYIYWQYNPLDPWGLNDPNGWDLM